MSKRCGMCYCLLVVIRMLFVLSSMSEKDVCEVGDSGVEEGQDISCPLQRFCWYLVVRWTNPHFFTNGQLLLKKGVILYSITFLYSGRHCDELCLDVRCVSHVYEDYSNVYIVLKNISPCLKTETT